MLYFYRWEATCKLDCQKVRAWYSLGLNALGAISWNRAGHEPTIWLFFNLAHVVVGQERQKNS